MLHFFCHSTPSSLRGASETSDVAIYTNTNTNQDSHGRRGDLGMTKRK